MLTGHITGIAFGGKNGAAITEASRSKSSPAAGRARHRPLRSAWLDEDKELVRKLAKRLAVDDSDASRLRAEMAKHVSDQLPTRGGIWAALRRSPLVGANLNLEREVVQPRDFDL
jgi:hypothetical protein